MVEYEHLTAGEKLDYIIRQRLIYPVFQPIVSLRDGKTLGFEALSRISVAGLFENVEEMFLCAEEEGKVWGLEQVCRCAVLEYIKEQKGKFDEMDAKLFINVNPKVLYDKKFETGFTKEFIKQYGIPVDRIVIEMTERQQVEDETGFLAVIDHYRMQGYQIAVDDVGSGYSGLNRICNLTPGYIKLDMNLIKGISCNPTKLALLKALVEFSVNSGTLLIAEGIETEKEMEMLIDLGVQYGQGYYLAKPSRLLKSCGGKAHKEIIEKNKQDFIKKSMGINGSYIKNMVIPGITVSPHVKIGSVLSYLDKNRDALGVCVVEKEKVTGVLTREKLLKKLGALSGYSMYYNKEIGELADKDFLQVEGESSICNVADIAMEREIDSLYDFIVVKENEKYLGIVTVRDLLQNAVKVINLPGSTPICQRN